MYTTSQKFAHKEMSMGAELNTCFFMKNLVILLCVQTTGSV